MRIIRKIFSKEKQKASFNKIDFLRSLKVRDKFFISHFSDFSKLIFNIEEVTKARVHYDDALVFKSLLEYQKLTGVEGDILEIGAMVGKTSLVLASCLAEGEKLFISDLFDAVVEEKNDFYKKHPTQADVINNLRQVLGEDILNQIVPMKGLSSNLSFSRDVTFRFVHVDGGHGYDDCYNDLKISFNHLSKNGIVAVDDYFHERYPDVKRACDDFISNNTDVKIFLDLNRTFTFGRKLLLTKK